MKKPLMVLLLLACLAAIAGCGASDEETEAEREAEGSGRGTVTCEGSATSDDLGMPTGFPEIEGVTWVSSVETGPSRILDGYAERPLEDLYNDFKSGFEEAGWSVTFDEIEEDDAEIAYRVEDESSDGIVALRSCDEDKTSMHVTNRPE
jgi:hypothetical protein